jgi:hypothetical protein
MPLDVQSSPARITVPTTSPTSSVDCSSPLCLLRALDCGPNMDYQPARYPFLETSKITMKNGSRITSLEANAVVASPRQPQPESRQSNSHQSAQPGEVSLLRKSSKAGKCLHRTARSQILTLRWRITTLEQYIANPSRRPKRPPPKAVSRETDFPRHSLPTLGVPRSKRQSHHRTRRRRSKHGPALCRRQLVRRCSTQPRMGETS